MSPISDKDTALTEVKKELESLRLYSDAKSFVLGEGNPDSDIMFVGEAPGQKEDEQGRPFVGAAGKFLNEMLGMIGLERSDVYITNIVKQRPPQNRDPMPDEIAKHWPLLQKQIKIIDPKIIVMLGRHSMGQLLPNAGTISQIHGRPFRRADGRVYLPLYHPAAALYNAGSRETHINDFKKIPLILKKLTTEKSKDPNN